LIVKFHVEWFYGLINELIVSLPNSMKAIFQKKKEKESPIEGAQSSTGEL